jgi:hypothetical protein
MSDNLTVAQRLDRLPVTALHTAIFTLCAFGLFADIAEVAMSNAFSGIFLDGGKTPDITGAVIGLFSMTAPGIASAKDWAELTAGVRLPVWTNGAVTASVTPHQPTTYVSRVGITQAF